MKKKKSENIKIAVGVILLVVIVFAVVFVIFLLNNNKTTTVEGSSISDNQEALVCTRGATDTAAFYAGDASSVEHKIKILADDKKVAKVFYEYKGKFKSEERAKEAVLHMGIDYDLDMQDNNPPKRPASSFTNIDTMGKVELYGSGDVINEVTAKYFFVDKDSVEKFRKYNLDEIEKYYKSHDFKCKKQ